MSNIPIMPTMTAVERRPVVAGGPAREDTVPYPDLAHAEDRHAPAQAADRLPSRPAEQTPPGEDPNMAVAPPAWVRQTLMTAPAGPFRHAGADGGRPVRAGRLRLFGVRGLGEFTSLIPLFLLLPLFVYAPWGLYPSIGMHPVVELRELTRLNTIAYVATMAACIATRASLDREVFFSAAWVTAVPLVPFFRALVRPTAPPSVGGDIPSSLSAPDPPPGKSYGCCCASRSGLRPCAVVDPLVARGDIQGVPYLNRQSFIHSFIRRQGVQHSIIALPDMPQAQLMEVIDLYREEIPYLMVMSGSTDMPLLWGTSHDCGGMGGIEVRNGLMLAGPRFLKRLMDIFLASAVMIWGFPIFLFVAILVKCTSRGPLFYGTKRLGFRGAPFMHGSSAR